MLEDFRLRVFEAVAETGSFTKAASLLAVSQPAVSQNIAELEKLAGYSLFDRSYGKVTLTQEGRVFKSYADKILMWYKAAGETFKKDALLPKFLKVGVSDELCASVVSRAVARMASLYDSVVFEVGSCSAEDDIRVSAFLSDGSYGRQEGDSVVEIPHVLVCRASLIGMFNGTDSVSALLETGARLAVWNGYRNVLPLELSSSVTLWSDSSCSLLAFASSISASACLLPLPMAAEGLSSRSLVRIPADFLRVHAEISVLPSEEFALSPLFRLFVDFMA